MDIDIYFFDIIMQIVKWFYNFFSGSPSRIGALLTPLILYILYTQKISNKVLLWIVTNLPFINQPVYLYIKIASEDSKDKKIAQIVNIIRLTKDFDGIIDKQLLDKVNINHIDMFFQLFQFSEKWKKELIEKKVIAHDRDIEWINLAQPDLENLFGVNNENMKFFKLLADIGFAQRSEQIGLLSGGSPYSYKLTDTSYRIKKIIDSC